VTSITAIILFQVDTPRLNNNNNNNNKGQSKGEGEVHPITCYEGPKGEWNYRSALSLISALDGVGG
jgi:hypothetical protein